MHLKLLHIVLSLISGFSECKKHLPCSQTDEMFPEVIVHQLTNHHELRKITIYKFTVHNIVLLVTLRSVKAICCVCTLNFGFYTADRHM